MLRKEDIQLIEGIAMKIHKKLNCISRESPIWAHLEHLTPKEVQTVFVLGSAEGKTMGEIAAMLGVTVSTTTTIIDRLIEKEYAFRRNGEEDRRQVLVELSEQGRAVYDQMLKKKLRNLEIIFGALSEDEWEMFRKVLNKLDKNL